MMPMTTKSPPDPKIREAARKAGGAVRDDKSPFTKAKDASRPDALQLSDAQLPVQKLGEEEQGRLNAKLLMAAEKGDTGKVRALIAEGADVNARDELLWTPLMRAAAKGHTETAETLIALGAGVDAQDNVSWTALFHASFNGHTETAEMLINRGAVVNKRDAGKRTPLSWAKSNPKTFAMLERHGATL